MIKNISDNIALEKFLFFYFLKFENQVDCLDILVKCILSQKLNPNLATR